MYNFYVYFSEDPFVATLVEEMTVLYGEPFSILYTIASSSNGTDNNVNETLDLFIKFESPTIVEPIDLNPSLLSVVSGNLYQLTIPSANSGSYRLIAEGEYLCMDMIL